MNYKIENGIPLPKYAKGKLKSSIKYPLKDMRVTQSFVTEEPYDKKHTNKVRARLNLIRGRQGLQDRKFSVGPDISPVGQVQSDKIRVWRTE